MKYPLALTQTEDGYSENSLLADIQLSMNDQAEYFLPSSKNEANFGD
jgi:hypothetical protein